VRPELIFSLLGLYILEKEGEAVRNSRFFFI
jgi:hypothetical protein